jgi:hypothetical protein
MAYELEIANIPVSDYNVIQVAEYPNSESPKTKDLISTFGVWRDLRFKKWTQVPVPQVFPDFETIDQVAKTREVFKFYSLSCLVVDIPKATPETPEQVNQIMTGYNHFLYTTFTHAPHLAEPIYSYRLIAPLAEEVGVKEYQGIANYFIDKIGVELCSPVDLDPFGFIPYPCVRQSRLADYQLYYVHYHDARAIEVS